MAELSVNQPEAGHVPNWRADEASAPPSLTVIVPTRNEAGNIKPLLERVQAATKGMILKIIFVDDSSDHTPQVIQEAAEVAPFEVSLIARPPERRNGLGKAVVEGISAAQSEWVCVMDGDLQHPPEVIPQLMDKALTSGSTLVAASRLTEGGGTDGLSFRRTLISYVLALGSRLIFPKRLRQVTDPLTGFFLVRRDTLAPEQLRPEGFKILLEIMVRTPELKISEVPFEFAERHAGESKANSKEAFLLFQQMLRLHLSSQKYFARFMTVGVSGLVVNNVLLIAFVELFGLHYLLSAVLSTQGSTTWNFAWTEGWVYRDRPKQRKFLWLRLGGYLLMNNAMLLLRGPMLAVFVTFMGMHYLVGNILSLALMTLLRYAVSDRFIWKNDEGRSQTPRAASQTNSVRENI